MIEGRIIIKNVDETRKIVESLGGIFQNSYACKDIIYVPLKESFDLTDDVLRIRLDQSSSKVIVARKQAELSGDGKIDNIILKKDFESVEDARSFIRSELPDFKEGFEYSRDGWRYKLENADIYIEDIHEWAPSVEIECGSAEILDELMTKIGYVKIIKSSMAEAMRKILNK